MGFSDAAGHKMAMLGMEQYALALLDGFTGLVCVTTPQEAGTVHAQGRIALWRPSPMVNDSDIDQNWNVTSDSLAAWYAHQSGARTLLLVKSVDAETAPDLHGLVDACLPSFSKGSMPTLRGLKRLHPRLKSLREAAFPALASTLLSRHERSHHEKSSDAALGLGVDGIRSFFHRMPRHDPHAGSCRPLCQQGRR